MTDKVTIDGVELTREQIETALAKLNETDTPKFGRWKPEEGDVYYYIAADGQVWCDTWVNKEGETARFAFGNVYRTREEAQNAAARQRAEVRLKDWAAANGAFVPKPGERYWFVSVNLDNCLYVENWTMPYHPDQIAFRAKEDAIRFICECSDDLKIFWGIG